MKHPSAEKWALLYNILQPYAELTTEKNFNMKVGHASIETNLCDTVFCIGGWYAIAFGEHNYEYINYHYGANAMAKFLGFTNQRDLLFWAACNPDRWLSKNGFYIFTHANAWNNAKSLSDCVEHIKKIAENEFKIEEGLLKNSI